MNENLFTKKPDTKKGLFGGVQINPNDSLHVKHESHKGLFAQTNMPKGLSKMQEEDDD